MAKSRALPVGKVTIGGKRPTFILGPCVIESEKFVWRMAKKIAEICSAEDIDFIFKASYDKANRRSVAGATGRAKHCRDTDRLWQLTILFHRAWHYVWLQ